MPGPWAWHGARDRAAGFLLAWFEDPARRNTPGLVQRPGPELTVLAWFEDPARTARPGQSVLAWL